MQDGSPCCAVDIGMAYLRDTGTLVPEHTSYAAAKELVYELDRLLGVHSVIFHHYLKHAWLVPTDALKVLMRSQGDDALTHLRKLGADVVWLGGVPVGGLCEQENLGHLDFEREGLYSVEAMLAHDLNNEEALLYRLSFVIEAAQDREVARVEGTLLGAGEACRARGKRLRAALG